jgi:hypothetical protein
MFWCEAVASTTRRQFKFNLHPRWSSASLRTEVWKYWIKICLDIGLAAQQPRSPDLRLCDFFLWGCIKESFCFFTSCKCKWSNTTHHNSCFECWLGLPQCVWNEFVYRSGVSHVTKDSDIENICNKILWHSYENKRERDIRVKIKNIHHIFQPTSIFVIFVNKTSKHWMLRLN